MMHAQLTIFLQFYIAIHLNTSLLQFSELSSIHLKSPLFLQNYIILSKKESKAEDHMVSSLN